MTAARSRGLTCHLLPAHGALLAAATRLLGLERTRLPDLSGVTVLLPNLHAAVHFGAVLAETSSLPVLLLPRLTTLPALAATVASTRPVLPDSRREAMLYQALAAHGWFREPDLWPLAAELARLFDELTACRIGIPPSLAEFTEALEQAYQAQGGEPLAFEARLVHELWHAASHGGDGAVDAATDYQMRLGALAELADGPLYAIGLTGLRPAEEDFLTAHARRQPVHRLDCGGETGGAGALLRSAWNMAPPPDADHIDLFAPLPSPAPGGCLKTRAEAFGGQHSDSPLAGRLALFPALNLEEEARAIDVRVRQWLLAGKRAIAVVVQDRLAARRARALLERAGVLVQDETGWTFSTVAAATVVMRWLDVLASGYYHRELLDLLKSPFVLADWPADRRKTAVYGLERLLRSRSIAAGLERYREAARLTADMDDTLALLDRLDEAARAYPRSARSLSAWLAGWRSSLQILGIAQGLGRDTAGSELLALLARLEVELAPHAPAYSPAAWRRWLNHRLETAAFRDRGIDSPVVFTHLANTRLRPFDAALIAGADAAHLPPKADGGLFFNQSVRAQLGLPTAEAALRELEADLAGLVAGCGEVLITWQAQKAAEANLASPWVERLSTFHDLAYGDDLVEGELRRLIPGAQVTTAGTTAEDIRQQQPAPALPPALIPDTVSASGYNSLMACPYQFFARYGLRLDDADEVQEELEKKDYGECVHRVLSEFHRRHPKLGGLRREALERELAELTEEAFASVAQVSYLARAWSLRWQEMIPDYLDWQLAREAEGWRVESTELSRSREFALADGTALRLKGRLDRVDARGAERAVIDYKTQAAANLRKKLESPGEDVQLPVYALLVDEPVQEALYLGLDKEVKSAPLPGEVEANAGDVADRLVELFESMRAGAALPAHGTPDACRYCNMRGLCRLDYWPDPDPAGCP